MAANEKLADLLSQKQFLWKVLVHLIDSGLHECRRVCRKWYEVCDKLPAKLSLSTCVDRCVESDVFPNAVSLKFDAGVFLTHDSVENHLLPCLSKLNRIARHEFCTKEWPLVHFRPNCLTSFNAVRSLSVTGRDESAFFDFLETLRCLTGLTELELRTEAIYINATDLAPITEIEELRTLKASSCFIVDRNDDFIFGTQQQLTKLEVRHEFFSASQSTTLQVMPVHPLSIFGLYFFLVALSARFKSALSGT